MKKNLIILLCVALTNIVGAQGIKKKTVVANGKTIPTKTVAAVPTEGIFATLETTKGNIVLELEYKKTPVTVANFISLAEGTNTFVKPEMNGKPFYNGLKWHRVIKDFMIQGGCPLGNGSGDPGYKFKDEFTDLTHKGAGILSMANSGPGTNGSQFFITHKETSWLNGKHTVFGKVLSGQNVVDAIAQDDLINKVTISRKGTAAKAFDAVKVFTTYFGNKDADQLAEKAKKQAAIDAAKLAYKTQFASVIDAKLKEFADKKTKTTKAQSGIEYITTPGNGAKPAVDATVYVHYAGYFEDGTLFDSSYETVNKMCGRFDQNRASANGYQPFPFKIGTKTGLIPGFLEMLELMSINDKATVFIPAKLGYGERGYGAVIPPNANLIFELEMLENPPVPETPAK